MRQAQVIRPHINKPGDVRFQDEPSFENQGEPLLSDSFPNNQNENNVSSQGSISPPLVKDPMTVALENSQSNPHLKETIESIAEQSETIKESLSEQLPSEALNVPPQEEASFWENTAEFAKKQVQTLLINL